MERQLSEVNKIAVYASTFKEANTIHPLETE